MRSGSEHRVLGDMPVTHVVGDVAMVAAGEQTRVALPARVFRAHDLALADQVRSKARGPPCSLPEQRRISVLLQFSTIVWVSPAP